MTKKILIDGDSIAYKAGFAENLNLMYTTINNTMQRIFNDCQSKDYELYIEEYRVPKTNFRKNVYEQYKVRPPSKCQYLAEARMYLTFSWNARIVDGIESEDKVTQRAYELGKDNCIVACIDKDLLCNPLTFYNYDEKNKLGNGLGVSIPAGTIYTVSEDEATLHLWRQVCTGDKVDNIPGVPGVGKVTACNVVDDPHIAALQAAHLYKFNEFTYDYFIMNYNLIKIRGDTNTDVEYPLTREQYESNTGV